MELSLCGALTSAVKMVCHKGRVFDIAIDREGRYDELSIQYWETRLQHIAYACTCTQRVVEALLLTVRFTEADLTIKHSVLSSQFGEGVAFKRVLGT